MEQVVRILLLAVVVKAGRYSVPLPNEIDCRIVRGHEVVPHSRPFQVLITTDIGGRQQLCGGSLISTEWVLTAAHCISDYNGNNIVVKLGVHNHKIEEQGVVSERPSQVVPHEEYNGGPLENDIGLVKLPNAVVLNNNIKTINLPRQSDNDRNFERLKVTLSGWGKLASNYFGPNDVLHSVELRVISNYLCGVLYGNGIFNSHLCTSSSARRDACQGDSGGPLTLTEEGAIMQIGIVSFGHLCAEFPGVYTRVSSYLDWISNTTGIQIIP